MQTRDHFKQEHAEEVCQLEAVRTDTQPQPGQNKDEQDENAKEVVKHIADNTVTLF
jgi:hypothetical protein